MIIVAIGGEPATGKSTLMRALLGRLSETERPTRFRLRACHALRFDKQRVVVLGIYAPGAVFAGTDRLSMAVQPDALRVIDMFGAMRQKPLQWAVLLEGDRLFNSKFFESVRARKHRLVLYRLMASPEALQARHQERRDTQGSTFLLGRKTKLDNILSNPRWKGMRLLQNEHPEDTERHAQTILDDLEIDRVGFRKKLPSDGPDRTYRAAPAS